MACIDNYNFYDRQTHTKNRRTWQLYDQPGQEVQAGGKSCLIIPGPEPGLGPEQGTQPQPQLQHDQNHKHNNNYNHNHNHE